MLEELEKEPLKQLLGTLFKSPSSELLRSALLIQENLNLMKRRSIFA